MSTWNEGDIVTLAYDSDTYMLAKIIHVEQLTIHDVLHLLIYDTLLEAGPAGYDLQGEYVERTHTVPDLSTLDVAIDHFAITSPAFRDCNPLVVEYEEVAEGERKGYAVWVTLRREQAVRRGLIRQDSEQEHDDEEYDEEWSDEHEGDEDVADEDVLEEYNVQEESESDAISDSDPSSHDQEGSEDIDESDEDDVEYEQVPVHTWHDTVFDVPAAQALIELSDIFTQEEFADSVLASAILQKTEASSEEIQGLVHQLVHEGDYGAGQDLLVYGDPAADALNEALKDSPELQSVEDILQILGDMGSTRAYEHIATLFTQTIKELPSDPLAVAAARSFCYVVMLTGGTPEPLRPHLTLLEQLDYPELREDAENAIQAIHNQGTEVPKPGEQSTTSSDPFGNI